MYTPGYNDYPPMNVVGYNQHVNGHPGGYTANTNNKDVSSFTLQQHNMHGGNDLKFAEGCVPYGFYDQSNFTGVNSAVCGPGALNYKQPQVHSQSQPQPIANYPMNYGMNNALPIVPYQPRGNELMKRMETNYNHECNYDQGNGISGLSRPKYISGSGFRRDQRKNIDRRHMERSNVSRLRKGNIDINIETTSNGNQGITLDLNIDV